jgi:chromosome segregation ATPase
MDLIEALEKASGGLGTGVDGTQKAVAGLKGDLAGLAESDAAQAKDLSGLKTDVAGLYGTTASLAEADKEAAKTAQALATADKALDARLTSTEKGIDGLKAADDAQLKAIADQATKSAQQADALAALKGDVAGLAQSDAAQAKDLAGLKTDVSGLYGALGSLSEADKEAAKSAQALATADKGLEARLTSDEKVIDGLKAADDAQLKAMADQAKALDEQAAKSTQQADSF